MKSTGCTFYISRSSSTEVEQQETVMVIIDTAFAVTLALLVAVAQLTGIVALAVGLGRTLVRNRSVRLARRAPIRSYYRHLSFGR
jgi:hypothetical protein